MAKVVIVVDTEEKTIEVKLNGDVIDNVTYVNIYKPSDDSCYHCGMVSIGIDEESFEDVRKHSYITAEKITFEKAKAKKKPDGIGTA